MAYLLTEELELMGFKFLGQGVKVSSKASIYDCDKIEIGDNSRIDDFCVVSGKLTIGMNVHIAPMCLVAGGEKGIVFEDFTTLAYGVQIFSQSDDYSGETMCNSTVPKQYKNEFISTVIVKKHTIIGAGATIMPGVVLAEGSSIGAKSLVLESTEPWGVYVGQPAKRLKKRKDDLLLLEKAYLDAIEKKP